MKDNELLKNIYDNLTDRNLNDAIMHMENYLAVNPHQINSDPFLPSRPIIR
jgi:outer membrane protein assembly factor BamD (BamD/ComL family)